MTGNPLRYAAVPGAPLSAEKALVLDRVPRGARVLEVGAHTGDFSAVLTAHGAAVTAVEANPFAAARIGTRAARTIVGSIEDAAVQQQLAGPYDVVLAMHVLEHLVDPWQVLRLLASMLTPTGTLIVLLPNVAAWRVRKDLFFRGTFEYEEVGILDRTHLRFFTTASARALIESAALEVITCVPAHVCVPLERRLRVATGSARLAAAWTRWMTRRFPNLTAEILLLEARRTGATPR